MNIFDYFSYIINAMLGFELAYIDGVFAYFMNCTEWVQIFNPVMFLSAMVYICVGVGLFQICCIFPFRLLKKLIKYPSRKSAER